MDNKEVNTWALVNENTNLVENTVLWDGETAVDFGDDIKAILIDKDAMVSKGYTYGDEKFTAPLPIAEDKETISKQAIADNIALKSILISQATTAITVWQTKLLLGRKLSDAETKLLNAWLDYIDLLNVIDADTSEAIKWPDKP